MSLPRRPRLLTPARSHTRSLFFAPHAGFLRHRLTAVLSALTTAFLAVGLVAVGVAAPASAVAAKNTITAVVSCSSDYHWTVTWSVQNTSSASETISASSDTALVPVGTAIGAGETKTFTETFSGPVDKTLTLDGEWPYSVKSHDQGSITTGQFTGTCAAPPPPPPAATCVPDSAISYTYSTATNSGAVTVAKPANSTGVLCTPLYVTATSWKFTQNAVWPQTLDQVQKLAITASGTYPYSAALACGQGDIYASRGSFVEPTSTLAGSQAWETFLSGYGFATSTPGNSYTVQPYDCYGLATPVAPSVTSVTACGTYGTVTAAMTTGVVYVVTFDKTTGAYTVTATPAAGYHFTGYQTVTFTGNAGTYTECPPVVVPPTPRTNIVAVCGVADVHISNDFTPAEHTIGQDFTAQIFVDGQLKDTVLVASGSSTSNHYTFVNDSGEHLIEVKVNGGLIGSTTVESACALVTAADPTAQTCVDNQLVDGQIFVALNDHIVYRIDGTVVTTSYTSVTTGTHDVTAELVDPNAGYTLQGEAHWTFVVPGAPTDCGQLVTHPLVTPTLSSSNQSCSAQGFYTLDAVEGVVWTVNGTIVPAGTYAVTSAKTVEVLASTVSSDFGFEQDAQTDWTLTFTDPANCGQLNTLAFTGAGGDTGGMLIVGLLFLLAGAGVYTVGRVKRARAE
jgi:hypothetical protein